MTHQMMLRSLLWILEVTLEMGKGVVRNKELRPEELTASVEGPAFDP